GAPQIYSISANGGQPNRLTFSTNYNTDPDWSPRGDRLAFTTRIEGRFQICSIRPDGSDLRVLTTQGSNQDPAWSPDGRMIAFSSDRRGRREIFVMDARGEIQMPVSPIPGKAPAWSPPSGR
ncbi:MAG: PD40 domain-containing protein, partial [Deltaproteobacteria bacterium]|nr:PD40 domain-containing protein [Deltaproteobacteria bacterium]